VFDPALGDLYEELAPQLLRYAEGILGSRADAEEAVQDAFLAAASAVPLHEPRLWLFRVTRNAAINQLRGRRRLSVLDPDADPVESPQPTPHDRAELADDLRVLRDGLDRLPEQQRSALMLRELGGLPYREIAGVVDASEANVKVLIFRARRSLQEFAEAVRLPCDDAQMTLSAYADHEAGTVEFARARLHTATCSSCRAFNTAIQGQRSSLAMLVPLAPLAGVSAGAALGAAAGAGAKAGGGLGGFFGMKAAATAAAVVVVGTGAMVADHEGIGLRRGGDHKPVPARVDRAIVPSDPQPQVGGGGGGGGAAGGSEDSGGGGANSGPGSSGEDRGDDHSGKGDGGDDNSGRGGGGDDEPDSGSDSSGSGSGSGDEPPERDEPETSGSGDSGSDSSGSGSGKSGSGSGKSGSGDEPPDPD
jgi:RNA polymerase sigma factor (sigma-70 family)